MYTEKKDVLIYIDEKISELLVPSCIRVREVLGSPRNLENLSKKLAGIRYSNDTFIQKLPLF